MKSKMINPTKLNEMEMFNIKNQAKMAQIMQKIGKSKRKIDITLSKSSIKYLSQVVKELKKQMISYEKQLPNLYDFFNYLEKNVTYEKGTKVPKKKTFSISYDEQDYLVMQIRATIKEIENQRANLKWYNIIKKIMFSSVKTQNNLLLDEVLNRK